MNIRPEIHAGGAWLDERKPGWFNDIDLRWLNLGSCKACVLGQLYSTEARSLGYGSGYSYVRYEDGGYGALSSSALGFGLNPTTSSCGQASFRLLTNEWKEYILQRREDAFVAEAERLLREPVPV